MTWRVLTTHPSGDWIKIQARQFERFLPSDRLVYSTVAGAAPRGYIALPDRGKGGDLSLRHQTNLNNVTRHGLAGADDDDFMLIFDGDAWPIAPLELETWLAHERLVSIEFSGRRHGQRSRCVNCAFLSTTVGFWRHLGTGWERGRGTGYGGCWDTNGALTAELRRRKISWRILRRSNRLEPAFPLFGCYERAIYHHGSGFYPVCERKCERRFARVAFPDEPSVPLERKRDLWRRVRTAIERDPNFFEVLT